MTTININRFVQFVLTKRGAEILQADHDRHIGQRYYQPKKFQEGQQCQMQLWDFMAKFGPFIGLGYESPALNSEITLK